MRVRWLILAAAVCLGASALLGGSAPLGRALLGAGLPRLASPFLSDPAWRGVALYRAGDWTGAEAAFRAAGQMFNAGNARAHKRDYAAALEAYDMARLSGDPAASANFDLLSAYYAGLALDPETPLAWFTEKDGDGEDVLASVAQGNARAAGGGSESTNAGALIGLPELRSRGRLGIRRVFDDKFMVANERWLATLSDVPGDYLAARITHEFKRRRDLGLLPPDPEDPR
ncbi:hypothetical protein ACOXXX_12250 [Thalassococcus sp. BH17M4-6]|uniref:hypothetical protein n=1 Tax=Thalassococcus sp. BH17M4-6 TaxID=3413148 RepID=UPI003BEA4557